MGSGEFYNSSFAFRLNVPKAAVAEFLEEPESAPPKISATFFHELHHLYSSTGTSYGWFLMSVQLQHAFDALRLASEVRDRTGSVHKPLVPWLDGAASHSLPKIGGLEGFRKRSAAWIEDGRIIRGLLGSEESPHLEDIATVCVKLITSKVLLGAFTRATRDSGYASGALSVEEASARIRNADPLESEALRTQAQEAALAWRGLLGRTPSKAIGQNIGPDVGFGIVEWHSLLECAAKTVELINSSVSQQERPSEGWLYLESPYTRPLRTMEKLLGQRKRVINWLEYLFIFDLAVNPALDPRTLAPDSTFAPRGIFDFLPGWRFARACDAMAATGRPEFDDCSPDDFDSAYRDFGGRLCSHLGWEPPWQNAERLRSEGSDALTAALGSQFLRACQIRAEFPALFALFPVHRAADEAVSTMGELSFAAADTSPFTLYFGRSSDPSVRAQQHLDRAELDSHLDLVRYADQLMTRNGPFELNVDPKGVRDEVGEIEGALREKAWTQIIPQAQLVFD
jgi:hypothetical protein